MGNHKEPCQCRTCADFREFEKNAIRKAFGNCNKCYGKGYSTQLTQKTLHADFIGDETLVEKPRIKISYCSCDRGHQLERTVKNLVSS